MSEQLVNGVSGISSNILGFMALAEPITATAENAQEDRESMNKVISELLKKELDIYQEGEEINFDLTSFSDDIFSLLLDELPSMPLVLQNVNPTIIRDDVTARLMTLKKEEEKKGRKIVESNSLDYKKMLKEKEVELKAPIKELLHV